MTARGKILVLILSIAGSLNLFGQGLHFEGMGVAIDQRTSLYLFDSNPLKAKDNLKIEFDARIQPAGYGYLLQVQLNEDKRESSTVNILYDCRSNYSLTKFNVILEGKSLISEIQIPAKDFKDTWHHLSLSFDFHRDSLYFGVDSNYTVGPISLSPGMNVSATFGKSHSQIDVPSFSIRNLEISDSKRVFSYSLAEDSGNTAYCKKRLRSAKVKNPYWIMNDSRRWKKVFDYKSNTFQTVGYDSTRHRLYDIIEDSLILADVANRTTDVIIMPKSKPVRATMGTSILNPLTGDIIAYEFYSHDQSRPDQASFATLDMESLEWTVEGKGFSGNPRMRNTVIYDKRDNRLIGYGGYGRFKYCGDFYTFDKESNSWVDLPQTTGDPLYPRFQHSMGFDPQTRLIYIFGGVGSINGEQILGKHLYTLHCVDIDTMECTLLWEIEWDKEQMIPVENMVLDNNGHFYTLMYTESVTDSSLQLYKFNIEDGEYDVFEDSIPIYCDRITCRPLLFFDKEASCFIATVKESEDDFKSRTKAYTLAYPPIHFAPSTVRLRTRNLILLSSLILLILLAIAFIIYRTTFGHRKSDYKFVDITSNQPKLNSIYLFGDFTAYDSNGEDISSEFYSKLRGITSMLISKTSTSGISTQSLTDTFWPNREEAKAKNIRGVTLNNLRKVLSKIDGISLTYADGRYFIETSPSFYCDYIEVFNILSSEKPDIRRAIAILSRGRFLGSETDPALDDLKNMTDQVLGPLLEQEIQRFYEEGEHYNVFLCAKVLSGIDALNETSLKYSIKSLNMLGKKEEARKRYLDFTKLYFEDYQEEYLTTYEELVHKKH